eukprot:g29916.t1
MQGVIVCSEVFRHTCYQKLCAYRDFHITVSFEAARPTPNRRPQICLLLKCWPAGSIMHRLQRIAEHIAPDAVSNFNPKINRVSNEHNEVVIVGYARTPMGSLNGSLSSLKASQLGSLVISAALQRAKVDPKLVEEVFMGNVLSAGMGQAPAKQASLGAGIPDTVPCTTVNKVCASGMKSLIFATQTIALGHRSVVVAGGMESMSNVPYLLPNARQGYRLGHQQVIDGTIKDGLWDPYDDCHMGMAAEKCSADHKFSRQDQDEYTKLSYQRSREATEKGYFQREVVPVVVKGRKGTTAVTQDEEPFRVKFDEIAKLKPAFKKQGGTVTAASSSVISDGAAALVLMSAKRARELGIAPIATICGYADAATKPMDFTVAPALAVPMALRNANLAIGDVDVFELNEAFSVVALANMKLLGIDAAKTNVWGGAVSMGHPIGCSGARIVCTLLNVLETQQKEVGAAGICNGGGGASALVVRRVARK